MSELTDDLAEELADEAAKQGWSWPTAPPAPDVERLAEVWVAVMVVVSEVSFKDRPATAPLSGRAALFAPVRTEVRTSARVVAAAVSEAECRELLAEWRAVNPGTQGEEVVSPVGLGRVGSGGHYAAADQAPGPSCISCGQPIGDGFRCDPCTKAYWAKLRAADPDLAPLDITPGR